MGSKKPKKDKSEEKRQAMITSGTAKVNDIFKQYTPEFYDQRATDYGNWAMPQVEDQYKKAQEQLEFALARQFGTTATSTAADKQAELAKMYGLAKTDVTDQGGNLANQSRAQVENSRSTILNQLAATADPSAAANSAMNQQAILSQHDPYTPLGELFANITEGLAASGYPNGIMGGTPTTPYKTGGTTKTKPAYIV
jgi:hypothetical protein